MMLSFLFPLLVFLQHVRCHSHTQYDITTDSLDSFMKQYGDELPKQTPTDHLIAALRSMENWSIASNAKLPAASKYPYFRWIPFFAAASIPTNQSSKDHAPSKEWFDPMNCFRAGSMLAEYDQKNSSQIIIHLELFNKSSVELCWR